MHSCEIQLHQILILMKKSILLIATIFISNLLFAQTDRKWERANTALNDAALAMSENNYQQAKRKLIYAKGHPAFEAAAANRLGILATIHDEVPLDRQRFQEAVRSEPVSESYRYNLALSLGRVGMHDSMHRVLNGLYNENDTILYNKALNQYRLGQISDAYLQFKALTNSPVLTEQARINAAHIGSELGDYTLALRYLKNLGTDDEEAIELRRFLEKRVQGVFPKGTNDSWGLIGREEADKAYELLCASDTNKFFFLNLAIVQLQLGQIENSSATLRKHIIKLGESPEYYYALGLNYFVRENYQEARRFFEIASRSRLIRDFAIYHYAISSFEDNCHSCVNENFTRLREEFPDFQFKGDDYYIWAYSQFEVSGQFGSDHKRKMAMSTIDKAIEVGGELERYLVLKAKLCQMTGDSQYLEVIQKLVKIDPKNSDYRTNLGAEVYRLDQEKAEKVYRKSLKMNPGSKEAQCGYMASMLRQDKDKEALKQFQEIDSSDANITNNYGILLSKCAKAKDSLMLNEAIEMFKRSKRIEQDGATDNNLGLAYYQKGDYYQALSHIPTDPYFWFYNNRGVALSRLKKYSEARKYFDLAMKQLIESNEWRDFVQNNIDKMYSHEELGIIWLYDTPSVELSIEKPQTRLRWGSLVYIKVNAEYIYNFQG